MSVATGQYAAKVSPLGLHGEYILSWQEVSRAGSPDVKLKHSAWQATGSFFLTGEKNSWKSAAPKKPFDPKAGTFGALELAARYSELSIDDVAGAAGTIGYEILTRLGLRCHLNYRGG